MIIKHLWDFQKHLHQVFSANLELQKLISGVFYKVPQDTKFPYIQMGFDKVSNNSLKDSESLKFQIYLNIYSREAGTKDLYKIVHIIEELFSIVTFRHEKCELVALNFKHGALNQQNDGLTQVLSLQFSAILRKGI